MSDEPVRLSASAEALLRATPLPERDDWEAMAALIDERVRETEAKSTAPLWLMAPLPDEAHEPGAAPPPVAAIASTEMETETAPVAAPAPAVVSSQPSAAATPVPTPTGTPSLAALARSVAQKAGRPESARIAKESLSVVAAARAQSDGFVERVRSARPNPPPRRGESRAPSPAPIPVEAQAPPVVPRRSDLGPWIAIGGLGFALAAALLVIARREPAQLVVAQPAPLPPAVVASTPAPNAAVQPAAPSERAAAPEAVAQSEPPLQPSELPLAPKPATSAAPRPGEQLAMAARATNVGAGSHPAARPAPEAIQLDEAPAKSKAVAETAPPAPSGLRPAAGSSSEGGLPSRPSTGAVQAAVGSVMASARACVAGGAASPAQITFGPDGTVTGVSVSGPAAGTAAATCIEAALRRARVAPFTNPAFSLGVVVRP